jgi:uncharacterized membrane-anchored protein
MSYARLQFRNVLRFTRLAAMIVAVVPVLLVAIGPREVSAQEDQLSPEQQQMLQRFASIQWAKGPTTARIGTMAEIQIPEGYQFASSGDAQTLLELYGNPRNPNILGAIVPMAEDSDWTLISRRLNGW